MLTRDRQAGAQLPVSEYASVPASTLPRSIDFYRRVLGFRLVEDGYHQRHRYASLRSASDMYLMVYAHPDGVPKQLKSFSMFVDDLDRFRADLWDSGVPLATSGGEPRRRYLSGQARSLVIADPDGHRIEVFERCAKATFEESVSSTVRKVSKDSGRDRSSRRSDSG